MTDDSPTSRQKSPWWWVPSLYFTQALPNVFVMTVSTYAYTRMGISAIAIGYTSWLGLPWMLKPLWSPVVELLGTERRWIWTTEYLASAAFATVAAGYASAHFFLWTVVGYALLAIASATHDIAADGFYMRVLSPHNQTWFTGIRSVAFRGGWIYGEGLLVMLAGFIETTSGLAPVELNVNAVAGAPNPTIELIEPASGPPSSGPMALIAAPNVMRRMSRGARTAPTSMPPP